MKNLIHRRDSRSTLSQLLIWYWRLAIYSVVTTIINQGCSSPTVSTASNMAPLFPVQVGDFWIYQISRTAYSSVTAPSVDTYQLQQRVTDTYVQGGQTYFVVEESTRQTAQQDWKLVALNAACPMQTESISLENNIPLVRLVYPVSTQQSWNLNRYNTHPDTLLQYTDIGQPYRIGIRELPNTVSVVGANDSTLVGQYTYRRRYAYGVGLVYREDASLAFCQSTPACVGRGIIESGVRQTWALLISSRLP